MRSPLRQTITRAMLARIIADAALVNLSLLAALSLRFVIPFALQSLPAGYDAGQQFWKFVTAYCHNAWLLTLICLVVCAANGFYTYGRAYQGSFKALVIVRAIVQSYLFFGFLTYFIWDSFPIVEIPRGALLIAFALNLTVSLLSRTWMFLWERVIRPEREEARLRNSGRSVRNVLVIGGAGYIGSALLPKLLDRGYNVRVLDMFLFGTEPIESVAEHPRLDLVKGDFRHVDKVVEAMRGIDAVVHLGAIVGDPACDLDENVTIRVNLSATQMIAQVAKASQINRFIFASTCSVYGACDETLDEHSKVVPISLYGNTKLTAERGLQSMADENFKPTIVRFATIYGLSGRTRFDLVVNLLAAKAKIEGKFTINGGDQWRPFVHVDDAALAIDKALRAPMEAVGNQIFNIGSDSQNYRVVEIGELVSQQVPGAEMEIKQEDSDHRNYRVSFSKARHLLGFEPQWTVEQGITQVVEAVASGKVNNYEDERHSNVKFLSKAGGIEVIRDESDWSRELIKYEREPEFAT